MVVVHLAPLLCGLLQHLLLLDHSLLLLELLLLLYNGLLLLDHVLLNHVHLIIHSLHLVRLRGLLLSLLVDCVLTTDTDHLLTLHNKELLLRTM